VEHQQITDHEGLTWNYSGQTESGMHKLESPDGNQVKIIGQQRFNELQNPTEDVNSQPDLGEVEMPSASPEQLAEIERLQQKVQELKSRLSKLETDTNQEEGEVESGRIFSWRTGTYEPV